MDEIALDAIEKYQSTVGARRRRRRRRFITTPTNFNAIVNSFSSVTLNWEPSTGLYVNGYKILRDGEEIATVNDTTTYNDTGLSSETLYIYSIYAYNIFGGRSTNASITVTTPSMFSTVHFDDVADATIPVLGDITFGPSSINIYTTSTLPGHIALRAYSGRTNVGSFNILNSNFLTRASQFNQLSLDISSGNYDNLKIDVTGYDSNMNVIGIQTELIHASYGRTINLNGFEMVSKIEFKKNPTSTETRHPQAIGSTIDIGGRPRVVYDKGISITNIRYLM